VKKRVLFVCLSALQLLSCVNPALLECENEVFVTLILLVLTVVDRLRVMQRVMFMCTVLDAPVGIMYECEVGEDTRSPISLHCGVLNSAFILSLKQY
jgi:hypothetical protein